MPCEGNNTLEVLIPDYSKLVNILRVNILTSHKPRAAKSQPRSVIPTTGSAQERRFRRVQVQVYNYGSLAILASGSDPSSHVAHTDG